MCICLYIKHAYMHTRAHMSKKPSAVKSIRISYMVTNSYHAWIPSQMLQVCAGFCRWPEERKPARRCSCGYRPNPLPRKPHSEPPLLFLRKTSPETVFPQACVFSWTSFLYFCQSLTPLCNLWYPTVVFVYLCYSMNCEEFIVFQGMMFLPSCVFIFIKTEGESPAAGEAEK